MDSDKQRDDAAVDRIKGKAKDALGGLTGDEKLQGEGKLDQLKGKARETIADVQDQIDKARDTR